MALAAAYGQMGHSEEASKAVRELLKVRPDFATIASPALQARYGSEFAQHFIDGLRKAGLQIGDASK
jgi:hypothetical protein